MNYYVDNSSRLHTGEGLLNSAINRLPFELHLPGYNYCGPGTKLEKRLARGDKGVNQLDDACKEHDIAYSNNTHLDARHEADKILLRKALERIKAKNSALSERIAATGVATAIHTKVKLGMGLDADEGGSAKRSKSQRKCLNLIQRGVKMTQNYLKSLEWLEGQVKNSSLKIKTTKKAALRKTQKIKQMDVKPKRNKHAVKRKLVTDNDDDDDDDNDEEGEVKKIKTINTKTRKRKLENDGDDSTTTQLEGFKIKRRKIIKLPRKRKISDNTATDTDIPSKLLKIETNQLDNNNKRKFFNDDNVDDDYDKNVKKQKND